MSNFVQAQKFILHSNASISDTTITVKDFVGLDGSNLTLADFGTKGFATLNPGVANAEEAISFTGVTQNGDGTATLTGVSTQLTESPYTETSGLAKSHISGATFVLSNTAGFYDHNFLNKNERQTVSGLVTFADGATPQVATAATDPTDDAELIHKKFADEEYLHLDGSVPMSGDLDMDGNDINMATGGRVLNLTDAVDPQEPATLAQLTGSIAGAPPNASDTVKGVVEEATQAETDAGTDTGATGAKLFVPPSKLQTYVANYVDDNQRALSQFIMVDGLAYEWTGSAYGVVEEKSFFPAYHTKMYDSTNKILFLLCPSTPSNNSIIIRSYKFNEYFQITHENRYDLAEPIDDDDGMGADIYDGSLWLAFSDSVGDQWIAEYSINTTTGELTFVRNNEWANPALANTGSTIIVDDTHINFFNVSNNILRQVDRSDISTNTASTFSVVEEDETTVIPKGEVIGSYQTLLRMGDYFYTCRNIGLTNDNQQGNGFEWDPTTRKLIRRVSTNVTVFDYNNSYNSAVIDTTDNRLISFLDHKIDYHNSVGGKVTSNIRMNVAGSNSVTITTL